MQRFISDLQRRKVLRVAAAYLVGAWIVLQVALALQTAMSLSSSFSSAILALLIIGFPVTVVLSWFFEITPEGVKRTVASGDRAAVKPQTTDLILAAALALVSVVAVAQLLSPAAVAPVQTPALPSATDKTATASAPKLGDKSIVILPFASLSSNKDDAFFADGLTEETINILAQVRGLRVISRTSSFAFKGKDTPVPDIAKRLGVRYVLEGSVRRNGDGLRVVAQLIDVESDTHIWSQTYERTLADVFAVQDDIARAIARALNIELSVTGGGRAAPTTNTEAYRLHLQALEQRSSQFTEESLLKGIDLFQKAIKLDPNFAEAYAQLATFYVGLYFFDAANRAELTAKARDAANAALKLKPDLATAHAALANLALTGRDWDVATSQVARALAREPQNTHALAIAGHSQLTLGYFHKARASFEELARADPLFGLSTVRFMQLAWAQGDNSATEVLAKRILPAKDFSAQYAIAMLAVIARERGDRDEAARYAKLSLAASPHLASLGATIAKALKDTTWRARAVSSLRDAAIKDPNFPPEGFYVLVGATDFALDAMRARAKSPFMNTSTTMMTAWHMVAMGEGANPKFKALLQEMHMVDHWKKNGWPDKCRPTGEDDFECS